MDITRKRRFTDYLQKFKNWVGGADLSELDAAEGKIKELLEYCKVEKARQKKAYDTAKKQKNLPSKVTISTRQGLGRYSVGSGPNLVFVGDQQQLIAALRELLGKAEAGDLRTFDAAGE